MDFRLYMNILSGYDSFPRRDIFIILPLYQPNTECILVRVFIIRTNLNAGLAHDYGRKTLTCGCWGGVGDFVRVYVKLTSLVYLWKCHVECVCVWCLCVRVRVFVRGF